MTQALVSFCIPTYNRGRYLDSLLQSLTQQLADFPHAFEVFISDNGSDDDTEAVAARYMDALPLRYKRHASNRGSSANYQYLMDQAQGEYLVYVADDDCILWHRVAEIIDLMEANPGVGIAYAPWKLYDLVADKDQGQFYQQDRDVLIPQGQHQMLLDTLLRYSIFPEIYICRRNLIRTMMPSVPEQAFYAFVHASEFVHQASVLFLQEPYYISVTNYFADHQRNQAGMGEAEHAWDRYRGGLEYVLGRASQQVSPMERIGFNLRIQEMIAQRISVAIRLRMAAQRNPVETYYLAYRLKALGAEQQLPVPLQTLRSQAALSFLLTDTELNRDVTELVFVGTYEPELRRHVEELKGARKVRFASTPAQLGTLHAHNLVLVRGTPAVLAELPQDSGARIVHEPALLQKFAA